jgi:hypothetical protein
MVNVTIGFDTLIGESNQPAELGGYGPITAQQARALAFEPGSTWRRLTAPDGTVIHADPHVYKPTAAVARLVRLAQPECTFPNCTVPSQRCDLDHVIPFNQCGLTTPENLHPARRTHHRLKTFAEWTTTRSDDGAVTWTSPTGRKYTTEPHLPHLHHRTMNPRHPNH